MTPPSRHPRNRPRHVVAFVVTLLAMLAGCGNTTTSSSNAPAGTMAGTTPNSGAAPTDNTDATARPSPGCASAPPGTSDPKAAQTLNVGGADRGYLVAVPTSTEPAPMIILLHGMGSNAADIDRVSDLPARGTAAGAIVVSPDAVGSPTMWRAGGRGPDAEYLDALITAVEAHHCVDTSRVGIAGFSVGAVFAAAYGCTHQDRIAAIVTVEVDAPGPCTKPMPILAFHGTADPIVPYAPPAGSPAMGGGTGTEANLAKWAAISECAAIPTTSETGSEVTKLEWPRCANGSEVMLYKILGGQHDWPGKDPATAMHPSTQQISATNEAISFFMRHTLQP